MKTEPMKQELLDPTHAKGVAFTGEKEGDQPDDVPLYWQLFSKLDTTDLGTPDNPVHLLLVVGGIEEKFLKMEIEGMTLEHIFNHEPTEEEKSNFVPKEFSVD